MAIGNFTPEIWSAKILSDYDKQFVFGNVVNRDYEGDIRAYGDTVRINSLGPVSVGTWTKDSTTMTVQPLIGLDQTLVIDKADYFSFWVDDIDKAQNNPKVMGEAMRKAAVALAETADARIGGMYVDAGITMTTAACGPTAIIEQLAFIHRELDENNVPFPGRWAVIPPWLYSNMILAELGFQPSTNAGISNVDGTATFEAGRVGRVMGLDIYMSNNLTEHASHTAAVPYHYVMAGTREAITFADQIASVEAYRPEQQFADAVKGLHVYGMKVCQPKALVALPAQYSTV